MNFSDFVQAFDHDYSTYRSLKTELREILNEIGQAHNSICDRLTFKQYCRWAANGDLNYFNSARALSKHTKNKSLLKTAQRILDHEQRFLELQSLINEIRG